MNFEAVTWRKSSRSGGNGGECVELASAAGTIAIRDSKDAEGPALTMGRDEFAVLLAVLKR
ncbi:DUF397 domain-containing protein [Actinomadura decatromicini]|uniref:DUF397 domain-containing protein n=1 Tax=Actinomadura decatromicini TaxID=2604572 RepID=A0A5D3FDF9_9ACTN|nr:DUF397 domain-containing protein [Actinomadura decatromicini]TYK46008.1 DUF397 domain-containing protein [Actinomadura decatromicini]